MYRVGLFVAVLALGLTAEPVFTAHDASAQLGGGKIKFKKGKKITPRSNKPVPSAEIKSMTVTRVTGSKVELSLGLYKPGRSVKYDLEIFFVDGRRRYKLFSGKPTFKGQRGGMKFSTQVDVRGKQVRRGHLEAVVPACKSEARCKKTLRLSTGDLKIATHTAEQQGRRSIFRATVRNDGPSDSARCKAVLKIDGHKEGEKPIPALRVGRTGIVEIPYPSNKSGRAFEVKLVCRDLARGNNKLSARLP
jgi:hypothetical protein